MKNTTMVSSTGRRTLLNYNNNTNSGRRKGTDLALDQQFKYL